MKRSSSDFNEESSHKHLKCSKDQPEISRTCPSRTATKMVLLSTAEVEPSNHLHVDFSNVTEPVMNISSRLSRRDSSEDLTWVDTDDDFVQPVELPEERVPGYNQNFACTFSSDDTAPRRAHQSRPSARNRSQSPCARLPNGYGAALVQMVFPSRATLHQQPPAGRSPPWQTPADAYSFGQGDDEEEEDWEVDLKNLSSDAIDSASSLPIADSQQPASESRGSIVSIKLPPSRPCLLETETRGELWSQIAPRRGSWRSNTTPWKPAPVSGPVAEQRGCCEDISSHDTEEVGHRITAFPDPSLLPSHVSYPQMIRPSFMWNPPTVALPRCQPPCEQNSVLSFNTSYESSFSNSKRQSRRNCFFPSYDELEFSEVNHLSYVDTHCHLDFLFDRLNFKGTFASFRAARPQTFPQSYGGCVAVFCNPATFGKRHVWEYLLDDPTVHGAFGCHPKMATDYSNEVEACLLKVLNHRKVVALGEIGLDYSRINCNKEVQKKVFRRQLELALQFQLPIVIHCRDADDDTVEILTEMLPRNHKIHWHCFSSNWEVAQKWLAHFPNLYIGLTALVTFPSAKEVHRVARNVPLDRLLLETDAPYFMPKIIREGSRLSHPGMAIHVAAQVAALRWTENLSDVLIATRRNVKEIYGI